MHAYQTRKFACVVLTHSCDTLNSYACELQRSELETLLAMERAARAAVEKASANLNRSNMDSRFQTPSRTSTKNSNTHREFLDDVVDNIRVQKSQHGDIVTGITVTSPVVVTGDLVYDNRKISDETGAYDNFTLGRRDSTQGHSEISDEPESDEPEHLLV